MEWKKFFRPTIPKVILFFLISIFYYTESQTPILCFVLPCPQLPPTYLSLPIILVVSYLFSSLIVFLCSKFLSISWKNILKELSSWIISLKELSKLLFKLLWQRWIILVILGILFYLSILLIGFNFYQPLSLLPILISVYFLISSIKIQRLWLKLGLLSWSLSYLFIILFGIIKGFNDIFMLFWVWILFVPMIFISLFSPFFKFFDPYIGANPDADFVFYMGISFYFAPYFYFLIGAFIGYLIELVKKKS